MSNPGKSKPFSRASLHNQMQDPNKGAVFMRDQVQKLKFDDN